MSEGLTQNCHVVTSAGPLPAVKRSFIHSTFQQRNLIVDIRQCTGTKRLSSSNQLATTLILMSEACGVSFTIRKRCPSGVTS